MNKDIENIIKKNLPEKKEFGDTNYEIQEELRDARKSGFNQALSSIDTSLIADEVLKVVVEKIKEQKSYFAEELGDYAYIDKEDLILTFFPNKENENK